MSINFLDTNKSTEVFSLEVEPSLSPFGGRGLQSPKGEETLFFSNNDAQKSTF